MFTLLLHAFIMSDTVTFLMNSEKHALNLHFHTTQLSSIVSLKMATPNSMTIISENDFTFITPVNLT